MLAGANTWYHGKLWQLAKEHLAEVRCHSCGYRLAGTLAAGNKRCPECGDAVTADTMQRWKRLMGNGV
jgi:predicted RNA-binding Zn-ribbon protein involved in translation (DUF1610 family)